MEAGERSRGRSRLKWARDGDMNRMVERDRGEIRCEKSSKETLV